MRLHGEGHDCGYCLHSVPEDKHDIPARSAMDDFHVEQHALFGKAKPPKYWRNSAFLFNSDEVRDIELGLADVDWQEMLKTPFRETKYNGTVKFQNKTWPQVLIRMKGSSSVSECLTNQNREAGDNEQRCFKLSMKLKFPKGDHFYGLKQVSLFASAFDQAAVIDRFANSLFREVGLPAIRQNHVELKLSIDGNPARILGLHYLSDDVDDKFTETYYNGTGSVYKYVYPGDDEKHVNEGQKEGKSNATRMVDFGRELYEAKDDYDVVQVLKKYTYVNQWAKYMAVDRAIAHWDGPTSWWVYGDGAWTHNLQLYQDDPEVTDADKFSIIPWDMRMTFMALDEDTVSYSLVNADGWEKHMHQKGIAANQADGYAEWDAPVCDDTKGCVQCAQTLHWEQLHPSCTRISRAFARGLRKEFHEGARQLLAGPLQTTRAQMKLDRWHDQIKDYIQQDKDAGVYPGFEEGNEKLDDDWEKMFTHFRNVTLPRYITNMRNHVSCERGYDPNRWTDDLWDFNFESGVREPNPSEYDPYPLPSTWPTYADAEMEISV